MRLRTTLAAAAGVLALAGPAFAATPVPDCHALLLDDADGDQFLVTNANTVVRPTVAIDIDDVFLTGTAGSEKVNVRVADLTSSPNVAYSFRWDDPENFGYSYELTASFTTATGAAGPGTYSLWRLDPNGSWISLVNASGRTFTGPQGVIQWDKPASVTWPSTFFGVEVRADQYETNAFTDLALRTDTASRLSWSQPC